jgi:general secretion pathway protein D
MNFSMFPHSITIAVIRPILKTCALAALLLVPASELNAQTSARPGGSARGTSRAGVSTTTSRTTTAAYGNNGTSRNYRSNTMLGDAIIQVDPESRSLVVITDEETHMELDKIVRNLDRPKPQVLIKVVFIEVTYNKSSDIGVEGNYTFNLENAHDATTGSRTVNSTGTATSNGTTTTTTSTLTTPLGTPAQVAETLGAQSLFGLATATDGTFVRVVTDDWSATLRALAQRGKVEVLSRPSIMARNNQEAVIVVGQEVPFITNSRTDALGQITNTIQYDNIGIILRVTPFITSDGSVEMIVAPEISTLTSQTVPISSTASAPVIAKRSAETVVVTPNGATVVIGGLMEKQRTESVRKVPILGDIPLIGMAFRRTVKDDTKRELLIFLTPEIVSNPAAIHRSTAEEIDRTELVKESLVNHDLTRYLDGYFDKQVRRAVPVKPAFRHTSVELETTHTVSDK